MATSPPDCQYHQSPVEIPNVAPTQGLFPLGDNDGLAGVPGFGGSIFAYNYISSTSSHPDENGWCPCPVKWGVIKGLLCMDETTHATIKPTSVSRGSQHNNNPVQLMQVSMTRITET